MKITDGAGAFSNRNFPASMKAALSAADADGLNSTLVSVVVVGGDTFGNSKGSKSNSSKLIKSSAVGGEQHYGFITHKSYNHFLDNPKSSVSVL